MHSHSLRVRAPARLHSRSVVCRFLSIAFGLCLSWLASFGHAASNVVEYTYDAAGNITKIERPITSGFGITSFDPASGAVGATVTIYGYGFSATPANNTVKFNGITATVSASASGSISTTVPTGAMTGRVTVTVSGTTATSAQDFVVTVPGAPVISSFTPASGVAGTAISVSGSGFEAAGGSMAVKLNGVTASPTLNTTTAFTFVVPGAASSGRITATNASGTGQSTSDFIVPPAGVAMGDIETLRRLGTDGAAVNVTVGTAGKHALVTFDLSADKYYTVQLGQFAATPSNAAIAYKVIKPDNSVLASGNVGGSSRPTIHLPKTTAAGTYSLLVSPGIATFNANVRVATDVALVPDAATLQIATTTPGETTRFTLDLAAAQRAGLGVSGYTHAPSNASATTFAAFKPDGTSLTGGNIATAVPVGTFNNTSGNADGEIVATVAGTYTLVATTGAASTASYGIRVSQEITATLTQDVESVITFANVGQDGSASFTATAGDSLGLAVYGATPTAQLQAIALTVVRPDGTTHATASYSSSVGGYVELGAMSATGTYILRLDPTNGATGSVRVKLKQGASIGTSDPATAFPVAAAQEAIRFRFNATLNERLAANVAGITDSGTLYVYRPDRGLLTSQSCNASLGRCKVVFQAPAVMRSCTRRRGAPRRPPPPR
jgi:YD repeat-containing protein